LISLFLPLAFAILVIWGSILLPSHHLHPSIISKSLAYKCSKLSKVWDLRVLSFLIS